jgi:hypothetical protein
MVRDLSWRQLIDPPDDETLQTMSTAALIDKVKRVVIGPFTWSPASSTPATLYHQITLSLEGLNDHSDDIFCPDGRHIVLNRRHGAFYSGVECWNVRTGRRVWGWAPPGGHVRAGGFGFSRDGSEVAAALIYTRCALFSLLISNLASYPAVYRKPYRDCGSRLAH